MLLSVEGSFSCCILPVVRLQCVRRGVSSRTWRVQLSHLPQRARRFASPLAPGVAGWTLRAQEGGGGSVLAADSDRCEQPWATGNGRRTGAGGGGAPLERQVAEVVEPEVEGERRRDVRHPRGPDTTWFGKQGSQSAQRAAEKGREGEG